MGRGRRVSLPLQWLNATTGGEKKVSRCDIGHTSFSLSEGYDTGNLRSAVPAGFAPTGQNWLLDGPADILSIDNPEGSL